MRKNIKPQVNGECHLVRYCDDFIVLVQFKEDAYRLVDFLRSRFGQYGLNLHPDKTRVKSFGRYESINAVKQKRKANTFDFLGLTHYCTKSRHGGFLVGRRTAAKKYRKKVKELYHWFKANRNILKLGDLWKTFKAKLRGHYQYYGISGNYRGIYRYYKCAIRIAFKWLNRRSQCKSFNWQQFSMYLEKYPLPKPRIVHRLYALSSAR